MLHWQWIQTQWAHMRRQRIKREANHRKLSQDSTDTHRLAFYSLRHRGLQDRVSLRPKDICSVCNEDFKRMPMKRSWKRIKYVFTAVYLSPKRPRGFFFWEVIFPLQLFWVCSVRAEMWGVSNRGRDLKHWYNKSVFPHHSMAELHHG